MKYRYIAIGTFTPENKEYLNDLTVLGIDIPCSYTRNNPAESRKLDSGYSYRFGCIGNVVVIILYDSCKVKGSKNRKYVNERAINAFHYYTFEEFSKLGGKIYNLDPRQLLGVNKKKKIKDMASAVDKWIDETKDMEFHEEEIKISSFRDLFPSLKETDKPVYIDDEAYIIQEENEDLTYRCTELKENCETCKYFGTLYIPPHTKGVNLPDEDMEKLPMCTLFVGEANEGMLLRDGRGRCEEWTRK